MLQSVEPPISRDGNGRLMSVLALGCHVAQSNTLDSSSLARPLPHLTTDASFHYGPAICSTFHRFHTTAGSSATSPTFHCISKALTNTRSECFLIKGCW